MTGDQIRDESNRQLEALWFLDARSLKESLSDPDEGEEEYQTRLQDLERGLIRAQSLTAQASKSFGTREERQKLRAITQEFDRADDQLSEFKASRALAIEVRKNANRQVQDEIDRTLREGLLAQWNSLCAEFGTSKITCIHLQTQIPSLVVTLDTDLRRSEAPGNLSIELQPSPSESTLREPAEREDPRFSPGTPSSAAQLVPEPAPDAVDEDSDEIVVAGTNTVEVPAEAVRKPRTVSVYSFSNVMLPHNAHFLPRANGRRP